MPRIGAPVDVGLPAEAHSHLPLAAAVLARRHGRIALAGAGALCLLGGMNPTAAISAGPGPTPPVPNCCFLDQPGDTVNLASGVDSLSGSSSQPGLRAWRFNIFDNGSNNVSGAQVGVDTTPTGIDLTTTNPSTGNPEFTFGYSNPENTSGAGGIPCPSLTDNHHETCPSPGVTVAPFTSMNVQTSPDPQDGVPITTTMGYDSSRVVSAPDANNDSAVAVNVTLTGARYSTAGNDDQVLLETHSDNPDPSFPATVTANGVLVPMCSSVPFGTPCVRELSQPAAFCSGQGAHALLDFAQPTTTTYALNIEEKEGMACSTVKPGLRLSAQNQPAPTPTSCDTSTDCRVTLSDPTLGNVTFVVGSGQGVTSMASAVVPEFIVQYPPVRPPGAGPSGFVIGDNTVAPNANVTFWSSQWSSANPMSGDVAPSAFKGLGPMIQFGSNGPPCGEQWSTVPGNSVDPPATVNGRIIVRIASMITKTGPTVSGNTVGFALIDVGPGYGPAPGHPGVGTIEQFIFCPH